MLGTNKSIANKPWATYFHEYTPVQKIMFSFLRLITTKKLDSQYISFPLLCLLEFEVYPFNCHVKVKKDDKPRFVHIYTSQGEVE
jgi:hypothetical protein